MLKFQRFFLALVLALSATLASVCFADQIIADPSAIFDGLDELQANPLKKMSIDGRILDYTVPGYGLKSSKITHVCEDWYTGKPPSPMPPTWISRSVTIHRWQFVNAQDVNVWLGMGKVLGARKFPGWDVSPSPKVGDLTYWSGPRRIVFAKGKTLVRIDVNSKKLGADYTLSLARKIEAKL